MVLGAVGEGVNGGDVESGIVPAFDKELFVVSEDVQAAFEVAEQNGDGLDALFIGEIFEALFLNFVHRHAILALLFGFQIQLLELIVGKGEKITKFVGGHEAPQIGIRRSSGATGGKTPAGRAIAYRGDIASVNRKT